MNIPSRTSAEDFLLARSTIPAAHFAERLEALLENHPLRPFPPRTLRPLPPRTIPYLLSLIVAAHKFQEEELGLPPLTIEGAGQFISPNNNLAAYIVLTEKSGESNQRATSPKELREYLSRSAEKIRDLAYWTAGAAKLTGVTEFTRPKINELREFYRALEEAGNSINRARRVSKRAYLAPRL